MRILFIAQPYLNLHQPILDEMKRQGHEVFFLEDKPVKTDCYFKKNNRLKNFVFSIYNKYFRIYERYADNLFLSHSELKESFDCLFVIQGVSVSDYFIRRLKDINPQLKSVLYIWDSNQFYDYFRNVPYFDKAYSFDYADCQRDERVSFLPFYWQGGFNEEILYDLSCIGTDHDGRYRIVSELYKQAKKYRLKCFFRIRPDYSYNLLLKIRLFLFHPQIEMQRYRDYKECMNSEIVLKQLIPSIEVERIVAQSRCVVDTDRECQTGTTPRVIWALAQGKKIVSTNSSLKNLPFYNPRQISIISRDNPSMDVEFIKEESDFSINPLIKELHIDKWVEIILSF